MNDYAKNMFGSLEAEVELMKIRADIILFEMEHPEYKQPIKTEDGQRRISIDKVVAFQYPISVRIGPAKMIKTMLGL